jgi:phospholipid/cholesterol/gamma-HCH transport system permease protein
VAENPLATPGAPLRRFSQWGGRQALAFGESLHSLGAFALIALGVAATKFRISSHVIHPLIVREIHRFGVQLLPIAAFLGAALGLLIIGQTVSLLTKLGAQHHIGTVMVTVMVRELGPLVAALLVLVRVGTAIVVELGTARALGEVEALEALGIDPVHYLVVPRLLGMMVAVLALTVYLILVAFGAGYLFAFLQDDPLRPADYFGQLAGALRWQDFVLLSVKTVTFGFAIAVVVCFEGLARPLRLEDVPQATTRAVVRSLTACVLADALFIVVYLLW